MKEHNNRKKADKLAEYITGQPLRRYLARKVEQYVGKGMTLFDGASGSGQLAQLIDFTHLTACEIQQESCDALLENFPTASVTCDSFFNYQSDVQVDCAIMNPPFSMKFKELSAAEQQAIQAQFPWKKSGVVDDIFVLKSLTFTKRYGVFILFPGVTYRSGEKKFRELIGSQLVEMNIVQNGFEDTSISVVLIVIDKEKTDDRVKREIYDCKVEQVLASDTIVYATDKWEQLTIVEEQETIDIDAVNEELDNMMLTHLERHLMCHLHLIQTLNAKIDYLGFIRKARDLLTKYEVAYNFNLEI